MPKQLERPHCREEALAFSCSLSRHTRATVPLPNGPWFLAHGMCFRVHVVCLSDRRGLGALAA